MPRRKSANLKFNPEYIGQILDGSKTCTTRRERQCVPGQLFEISDVTFRVWAVNAAELGVVATLMFDQEGFKSPRSFLDAIAKIYPDIESRHIVYVHRFERVD